MNTPLARETKWLAGRFRVLQSSGWPRGTYLFFDLSNKYLDYLISPFLLFSNRVCRRSLHKAPLNCYIVLTRVLLHRSFILNIGAWRHFLPPFFFLPNLTFYCCVYRLTFCSITICFILSASWHVQGNGFKIWFWFCSLNERSRTLHLWFSQRWCWSLFCGIITLGRRVNAYGHLEGS
jgi:hypothetical protein